MKKNMIKKHIKVIKFSMLGITAIACIFLGLKTSEYLNPVSSGALYTSLAQCENSESSKNLPISCSDAMGQASKMSENMTWSFSSIDECYIKYSKETCYANKKGYLSVKASGFGFISGEKISITPFYDSSLFNSYLLPNGYPVKEGRFTMVGRIKEHGINQMIKSNNIARDICLEKCISLYNVMKIKDKKLRDSYLSVLEK